MKYQTTVFDMNKPTLKQVKVPLESDYGVAVKVCKDGQYVNADLSVDGAACTEGPNGWKLAELSSGNVQTMKIIDVELDVPPTASAEIDTEKTYTAMKMSQTSYRASLKAINNYLSAWDGMPEQITVSPDNLDFTAKYRKIKSGVAGEWTTYGGTNWRITHTKPDSTKQVITKSGDKWMSYVGGQYVYFDQITLNTSTDYIGFSSNKNITDTEPFDAEDVQTIIVDTKDGIQAKFQLYVQEQDLGYVEAD